MRIDLCTVQDGFFPGDDSDGLVQPSALLDDLVRRKVHKVTPEQAAVVRRLKAEGQDVAAIARAVGLSRPTVYSLLTAAGRS